jgi:hypothetical protein
MSPRPEVNAQTWMAYVKQGTKLTDRSFRGPLVKTLVFKLRKAALWKLCVGPAKTLVSCGVGGKKGQFPQEFGTGHFQNVPLVFRHRLPARQDNMDSLAGEEEILNLRAELRHDSSARGKGGTDRALLAGHGMRIRRSRL